MSEALGDSWNISDAPFPAAHQPTEQMRFPLQYAILHPRPITPSHGCSRSEVMPWNSILTQRSPQYLRSRWRIILCGLEARFDTSRCGWCERGEIYAECLCMSVVLPVVVVALCSRSSSG
jgi:hypothetical protein